MVFLTLNDDEPADCAFGPPTDFEEVGGVEFLSPVRYTFSLPSTYRYGVL